MRIRFFNTVEPVSPLYRDLLPFLSEYGAEIEVIIGGSEYRPGRLPLEDYLAGNSIRIIRVGGGAQADKNRMAKLAAMLSYMLGAAGHSLFAPRADLNFFLTQPPLFSLWGYLLRAMRGEPYLCLVMDVYPDVAIQDGLLSKDSILARALSKIASFILKKASLVIAIGRCMQQKIIDKGADQEKVHFIPNWVNEGDIYPIPHGKNSLRREIGLGDDFTVLYSGNMGVSHYFDDLLEVARRCVDHTNLKFVIIGDGARRKDVEAIKTQYGLKNVIMLPFQPPQRLKESLSLGDVHFVSLKEGFEGLEVPSKAYGTLAAGRPLVYQGNPNGEIARMVEEERIGFVVRQGDADSLEKAILSYLDDRSLGANQGKRALDLAQSCYSSKTALIKYQALLFSDDINSRGWS